MRTDGQTAEPWVVRGIGRAGAGSADAGVGRWLKADLRRWCSMSRGEGSGGRRWEVSTR